MRLTALCVTAMGAGIGLFWSVTWVILAVQDPLEMAQAMRDDPDVGVLFGAFFLIALAGLALTWWQGRQLLGRLRAGA